MDEFEIIGQTDLEMSVRHRMSGHVWDLHVGELNNGHRILSPSYLLHEDDKADVAPEELVDDMMIFTHRAMKKAGMIDR